MALLVLVPSACWGQYKVVRLPVLNYRDSLGMLLRSEKMAEALEMDDLRNSEAVFKLRIIEERWFLDLWTTDFAEMKGRLCLHTFESRDGNERERKYDLMYYRKAALEPHIAWRLYDWFLQMDMLAEQPPMLEDTKSSICDDTPISIELVYNGQYSVRESSWGNCHYYGSEGNLKKFCEACRGYRGISAIRDQFSDFLGSLPSGTYSAGGILMLTKTFYYEPKLPRQCRAPWDGPAPYPGARTSYCNGAPF